MGAKPKAGPLGLDRLRPVDLAAVLNAAELLNRVDRKYVLPVAVAHDLIGALSDRYRVLSIGGRLNTSYRTTYFDTDNRQCVRDHVQGRRRRFKARTRLYVEDELCRLEVKLKGRRGETLKMQRTIPASSYGTLSAASRRFVDTSLADAGMPIPGELTPSFELRCRRSTIVDLQDGTRITLDEGMYCGSPLGRIVMDRGHVVVETKSSLHASGADLWLLHAGFRPRAFSKYMTVGSLLEPDIHDNDVRRMLGVQIHVRAGKRQA